MDVGAASGHRRPDWVHARIAEVAAKAVGIDIDAEGVEAVQGRGFDVRLVNAQELDLGKPSRWRSRGSSSSTSRTSRAFLESLRRHLEPGGQLILTTPNAFSVANFVYRLTGSPRVHHEHTCWFCEDTLPQLLTRCGYATEEIRYLPHATPGAARRMVTKGLRSVLPDRLAWNTILAVARRVD